MKSNSARQSRLSVEDKIIANEIMSKIYMQAKAQFGDVVKAFWLHDGELCPGCEIHPIGLVKYKGEDALALNAFMYRERGVLIGYFLCESCANSIFQETRKHPSHQTPKHADIERNLIAAYHRYLASLDA